MSATSSPPESKTLASTEHKTQRLLLNVAAIACAAIAAWLIVENGSVDVSCHLFGQTYSVSLSALLAGIGVLTALATGLRFSGMVLVSSKQTQVTQRKAERLEVAAESSTERVKVLEHKIETLETALKKALADRKQ